MANIDAPRGFRAARNEYNSAPKIETLTAIGSTNIFMGEIVCYNSTFQVVKYTDALARSGKIIGVAAHFLPSARTDRSLQVYTDPRQVYEVQADDATLTNAGLYGGELFDIVNPTSGNTTLGHSISELDASSGLESIGTTEALLRPIRIEGVSKGVQNELNVSFTRYLVRFAAPVHHRSDSAGIGMDAVTTNAVFKGNA